MRQAIAEVLPELRPLRSSPLQIPAVISVVLVSLGWLLLSAAALQRESAAQVTADAAVRVAMERVEVADRLSRVVIDAATAPDPDGRGAQEHAFRGALGDLERLHGAGMSQGWWLLGDREDGPFADPKRIAAFRSGQPDRIRTLRRSRDCRGAGHLKSSVAQTSKLSGFRT